MSAPSSSAPTPNASEQPTPSGQAAEAPITAPSQCRGFSSDCITVEELTTIEWQVWYRKDSGDPWIEQNRTRVVPKVRFLTDPGQVLLRIDGTEWDSHIVQWKYVFLDGYDQYSFIRISNFPTMQLVKCVATGAFFMRSNWMILTSFGATFEEMEALDKTLQGMSATDSWERFNRDEATILNHGYAVPDAPQVVMRLAFALPSTHRMRAYLPPR